MRLYCSPGACSQAPHIAFREIGIDIELVAVDLASKLTRAGRDFTTLNPTGCVPLLEMDDGSTLRETSVILRFAAELMPSARLARVTDPVAALRLGEWLSFLASDVHQGLRHLAAAQTASGAAAMRQRLLKDFAWIDVQLATAPYLAAQGYSVADIYLWVIANWTRAPWIDSVRDIDLDLSRFDNICRWHKRVAQRPAVRAALEAERLLRLPLVRPDPVRR